MFRIDRELSERIVFNTSLAIVKKYFITGQNYYVKKDNELKEVIGYKLARLLDINCIKYEGININGINYSISRDINELGEFILGENIVCGWHDLLLIIEDVMDYSSNYDALIIEILKMYIYDILFLNYDRHNRNWGLLREKSDYKLFIFDNQNIFSVIYPVFIRFNPDLFGGNSSLAFNKIYTDFEEFLTWCPLEYIDKIYNMINRANFNSVYKILEAIKKEYGVGINSEFVLIYKQHYNRICEIMERIRGVKHAR